MHLCDTTNGHISGLCGTDFPCIGRFTDSDTQYICLTTYTHCKRRNDVLTCPSLRLLLEHRSSRPPQPHQAGSAFPSWAHTSSTGWSWDCNTPPCPCFLLRRAILLWATVSKITMFYPHSDQCISVPRLRLPDLLTNDVKFSFQRASSRTGAGNLHGCELGPYAGFGVINLGEVRPVTIL